MSRPLLDVRDLVIEFETEHGRRRIVDGISFSVRSGEVLGILGESGSGKTISTMAVLGLIAGAPGVVSGEITMKDGEREIALLDGLAGLVEQREQRPVRKDVRRWDKLIHRRMRPLWGRVVTAVFQNPRQSLDPLMTVGEQLDESVALAEPGRSKEEVRQVSHGWLDRVQLNDPMRVYDAYPHELSGGMCQRAMIAIAMARKPKLLIADEPTTGLDTTVRAEIVELFKDLLRSRGGVAAGRSVIYISHDVREVLHLADRVIVMKGGHILETATPQQLRYGLGERHEYTAFLLDAADLHPGRPN